MDRLELSRRIFLAAATTSLAFGAVSVEGQAQTEEGSEETARQQQEAKLKKDHEKFRTRKKLPHDTIKKIKYPGE